MIYQGNAITVVQRDDGIAMLTFDAQGESVNTLSSKVIEEFEAALAALGKATNVKGLVVTSAKDAFIVGADITEFHGMFRRDEDFLVDMNTRVHRIFNTLEDLPFPSVAAINGLALGGGCEITLACDFRVMSDNAKLGLPETKLGIVPGWGGCVRLPRLIGADNAIEWISGGTENRADAALKVGAVDAVVSGDALEAAALDILARANAAISITRRAAAPNSPR